MQVFETIQSTPGLSVYAQYYEPGMGFVGEYDDVDNKDAENETDTALAVAVAALLPKPILEPVKSGAILSDSYVTLSKSSVLRRINLVTCRSCICSTSIMHKERNKVSITCS